MKRIFILLTFVFFIVSLKGQTNKLIQNKPYFENELKQWEKTFNNFKLLNFKVIDTLPFENNDLLNFDDYNKFIKLYKPILTFSNDSSQFIDIYSRQINLEKVGNHYEASSEVDQGIYLCNKKMKYWNRLIFMTETSSWIDEAIWTSKTEFILVGIEKTDEDIRVPIIMIGNTVKQTLLKFKTTNQNCFQRKIYKSLKLKKIKIKWL